jgi:hypothetical protein
MVSQVYYIYLIYLKERLIMATNKPKTPDANNRFSVCPRCGRKGLYLIKQQYYRCRYCGAYMNSPSQKKDK